MTFSSKFFESEKSIRLRKQVDSTVSTAEQAETHDFVYTMCVLRVVCVSVCVVCVCL